MNVSSIRELVEEAITEGLLFRSEGTVLSSAEGFNVAGRAVLGALLDNAGLPGFNTYCTNQKKTLGWLVAKGNPISKQARDLLKRESWDPSATSMLSDVNREFIGPLVEEHIAKGGTRPGDADIKATCAVLVAKILWDLHLGNPDLSRYVSMLRALPVDPNEPPPDLLDETGSFKPRDQLTPEQQRRADEYWKRQIEQLRRMKG